MITYEVKIEHELRGRFENFVEGSYWWRANVYIDNSYNAQMCEYGWTRSEKSAKKQALKHILKVEKRIGDGKEFGVVFNYKGSSEELKKVLS